MYELSILILSLLLLRFMLSIAKTSFRGRRLKSEMIRLICCDSKLISLRLLFAIISHLSFSISIFSLKAWEFKIMPWWSGYIWHVMIECKNILQGASDKLFRSVDYKRYRMIHQRSQPMLNRHMFTLLCSISKPCDLINLYEFRNWCSYDKK